MSHSHEINSNKSEGITVSEWVPAIKNLPRNEAIFSIGDIHGQAKLLCRLRQFIENEKSRMKERAIDCIHTVYLGDYIDRGNASLATLDQVMHDDLKDTNTHCLIGNHEMLFLNVISTDASVSWNNWISMGGAEVLDEIGIRNSRTVVSDLEVVFGIKRIAFLKRLRYLHRIHDIVFVHAGIDPKLSIENQTLHTAISIREPFLKWRLNYQEDIAVVHGHTPNDEIQYIEGKRINLDVTGTSPAKLGAVQIEDNVMRFITVH